MADYEEYIKTANIYIKCLQEGTFANKEFAIDRYKENKKLYEETCNCGKKKCESRNKKTLKLTATVFCHIANEDKQKALIAFDKWKTDSIERLEDAFSGKITKMKLVNDEGEDDSVFEGKNNSSELLRLFGLMEKVDSMMFELLINDIRPK